MILNFFLVACGGALGAMGRYGLRLALAGTAWPWATFAANVAGGVFMGIVMALMMRGMDPKLSLFLGVGVLGGFTTFSSFSAESLSMLHTGQVTLAFVYMAASVICAVGGVALGYAVAFNLIERGAI